MYITVDVSESQNCPMRMERVFDARGEPQPISQVVSTNPVGEDLNCLVTGWSAEGPCQAYAVPVEDSGEGILMLVYGGDEGLRLRPVGNSGHWALDDPEQWGESCLLLARDVELS